MSRKGRDFELLIQKLEKFFLQQEAEIISPGFIKDKITDQLREVDILIKYKVGTSVIKIVIECRDRKAIQDSTWIEQINSKIKDINVHKAIAVSTSSFTSAAIKKAKSYNIETRTFSEIDSSLISSWWQVEFITTIARQFNILSAVIDTDNPSMSEEIINGKNATSKFIGSSKNKLLLSLNDLFMLYSEKIREFEDLELNGPSQVKQIIFHVTNSQDFFILKKDEITINIREIYFEAELSLVSNEYPISRISQYKSENETISQVVEINKISMGVEHDLQVIRGSDGVIHISIRRNV